MNTQKHNSDLKYCVYCGIRNNNETISCKECKLKMFKLKQRKYYMKHREEIIAKTIKRQKYKDDLLRKQLLKEMMKDEMQT